MNPHTSQIPAAGPFSADQEAAVAHERAKPPRRRALATLKRLRQEAEETIERLLTFLDTIEIDPDLEPSLGAAEIPSTLFDCVDGRWRELQGTQEQWGEGPRDDREGDDERESDPAELGIGDSGGLDTDDEPSLGALEYPVVREQKRSADGRKVLSTTTRPMSQVGWANTGTNDGEEDAGNDVEKDADFEPTSGAGQDCEDDPMFPCSMARTDNDLNEGKAARRFAREARRRQKSAHAGAT